MFAEEDISEDFSEDRRYHFYWVLVYFLDIFEIFTEDCFLLRRFRKFLPSGFLPLSRFQLFPAALTQWASMRDLEAADTRNGEVGKWLRWHVCRVNFTRKIFF